MSAKQNSVSVLIYRNESTPFKEINFLMKVAWNYAEKGLLVFIICGKLIASNSEIDLNPYLSKPEVLQRIIFRYFSESSEVLQWCHEMHKRARLPHVFMVSSLENFNQSGDYNAVEICAALMDSIQYCSRSTQKTTYLIVSACDYNKNDLCPAHLVPFFDKIWYLNKTINESNLFAQMYPSFPDEKLKEILQ